VAPWRGWAWIVAFVFIVAAVPVSFYLGVGAMVGLLVLRGPAAGGGEGSQADAYTALLFGGPLGVLIGTGLVGWFALRYCNRWPWPVIGLVFAVVVVASVWAMREMGPA